MAGCHNWHSSESRHPEDDCDKFGWNPSAVLEKILKEMLTTDARRQHQMSSDDKRSHGPGELKSRKDKHNETASPPKISPIHPLWDSNWHIGELIY